MILLQYACIRSSDCWKRPAGPSMLANAFQVLYYPSCPSIHMYCCLMHVMPPSSLPAMALIEIFFFSASILNTFHIQLARDRWLS